MFFNWLIVLSITSSILAFPQRDSSAEARLQHIDDIYHGRDQSANLKAAEKLNISNSDSNNIVGFSLLGYFECLACRGAFDYALYRFREANGSYDGLPLFIDEACKVLKIESKAVCDGIVNTFKPVVSSYEQSLLP